MSKGSIFIAEDEAIVCEDIKLALERHGYHVSGTAATGEEVVEKALKVKPDLLLLDIVLKGKIDGIEAAKQVYQKLNIPIVYVTAYADEKTLRRAKETEPYGYLIKPYNERDLLITVEIALLHYKPCINMLEQKCRNLLEVMPDPLIISDNKGTIILANKRTEGVFGYILSEMLGKPVEMLLPEEFRKGHVSHRDTYYKDPSIRPMGVWRDLFAQRKDGTDIPVSINLAPMETKDGPYVISVIRDITETKKTEAELILLHDIAHDIALAKDFQAALEVVLRKVCEKTGWLMGEAWLPSPDGSRLECSPAWYCNNCDLEEFRKASKEFTFLPGIGLPGRAWSSKESVWVSDVSKDKNFPRMESAKKADVKAGVAVPVMAMDKVVAVMDFFIRKEKKEDSRFVKLISLISAQLGVFIQQKLAEEHITYLAYNDILTDLPNRLMLHDKIEEAISNGKKKGVPFALFIIDLEHFRDINDTLGHHQGDAVLLSVAGRLKNIFANIGTVSRLGGDDFTVILPWGDAKSISQYVNTVTRSLDEPIVVGDIPINIASCIGVSLFPEHGKDTHTLLKRADVALQEARKKGVNWAIYSPEYDRFSHENFTLISELRRAIDLNDLFLLYQPKIDMKTNKTIGVEALVRWRHPIKGVIPPDQFIFLAEHSGLIKQLTNWVLVETLNQLRTWGKAGLEVSAAVNLSVKNLRTPSLLEEIRRLISTVGIDPKRLRFEITESAMMIEPKLTIEILTQLALMGICLSIDDFGTGFSSLRYLQNLPVDEVKIDKSFVLNMLADKNSMMIVKSTIELAHSLGLKAIAEGVESREILDKLTALGCDSAQGYFISRPIPPDEFAAWLCKRG